MSDVATHALSRDEFASTVTARVAQGGRLAHLYALAHAGGFALHAIVVGPEGPLDLATLLSGPPYVVAALTPQVPAADWYERYLHDLYGLEARGHPDLDPLVLPRSNATGPPRPPHPATLHPIPPDTTPLPALVRGEGIFTIPYGPVRSGVFESVEYVIETTGEDIPRVQTRIHYKHRALEAAFDGRSAPDGLVLAEHVEGVASMAHAVAYAGALEALAEVEPPPVAQATRLVHAELERVVNHLDSTLRHTEAAGQAVAHARLAVTKERVQRLRAALCGSRFSRGVVVLGGVSAVPPVDDETFRELARLEIACRDDLRRLLDTPSFLDRLRGTGVLPESVVRAHGALGPLARGSGVDDDARVMRPYGPYREIAVVPSVQRGADALARQVVRTEELLHSFSLVRTGLEVVQSASSDALVTPLPPKLSGHSLGWAEAPQGEVLYVVEADEGHLRAVRPRSASFVNLALFTAAFPRDITTDFAFIEASFGLSVAGAAL